MLQFINDLPEHVVGIHAIGEVTKEDLETVLVPRIEELVKKQGEINYTGFRNQYSKFYRRCVMG